jgi:hypothetical protein
MCGWRRVPGYCRVALVNDDFLHLGILLLHLFSTGGNPSVSGLTSCCRCRRYTNGHCTGLLVAEKVKAHTLEGDMAAIRTTTSGSLCHHGNCCCTSYCHGIHCWHCRRRACP